MTKVRRETQAGVLRDLHRGYTAENLEEAQAAWAEFRQCWGRVYPEVVTRGKEDLGFLPCFLRYPAVIRPYLRGVRTF